MRNRWQMNLAGIFNFWYYTDEVQFQLSDGRLVLRGANGSGKSVTMQSFLPLVLDGNKRPSRLDPFGSKDRKIDYYLLLEPDSGIQDRIGYLYLEFYHPEQHRYLTIGIGLRARRNAATGFWGFAITDNRRIGKDILLYEKDYSQGQEQKIPLTRSQLEDVIGEGGQVVTEQGKYMEMVNKLLFGYGDLQSFQELLDLLIQLRSPKLSKDFKPTTIYEILSNALPPLQDDELRPLSEVMEDMDQINDRLEEVSLHRREAEKLQQVYNRYNKYLLYSHSAQLLQAKRQWDNQQTATRELAAKLQELSLSLQDRNERFTEQSAKLLEVNARHEVLAASEALEKRHELNRLRAEKERTDRQADRVGKSLQYWQGKQKDHLRDQERYAAEVEDYAARQRDALRDMEDTAREFDFSRHDVYHRQWDRDIPREFSQWPAWQKDLEEQDKQIGRALEIARHVDQKKYERDRAEREVGNARQRRDAAEESYRFEEENCELVQKSYQEQIFAWRKGLQELHLSDDELQKILHRLSLFPEVPYESVKEPLLEASNRRYLDLQRQKVEWEQQRNNHREEKERLQAAWQEWKNHKDPEPPRTEARELSRRHRGGGAPLYAVCEFREGVSEELKASLEAALQQSGLLDAWVSQQGLGILSAEAEEVWIAPNPQFFGYTLADYLYPTPPEDSSLQAESIDEILRTISLGDSGADNPGASVSEQGYFRLGALCGKAAPKKRAEFIGKETRHRTRLAEMARLETLMEQEQQSIDGCTLQIDRIEGSLNRLASEKSLFPGGDELQEAFSRLAQARREMESALEEERQKVDHFRQASQAYQETTAELHRFMQGWTIPKHTGGLTFAREQLQSYRQLLGELRSHWSSYRISLETLDRTAAGLLEAAGKIEEETVELESLQETLRHINAQIAAFEKALKDLGIEDIDRQLRELEHERDLLKKGMDSLDKEIRKLEREQGIEESKLSGAQELLAEKETTIKQAREAWLAEWNRRLVAEWSETEVSEEQLPGLYRVVQQVLQKYRDEKYIQKSKDGITNDLFLAFQECRGNLHSYGPELVLDEEHQRNLVLFMRDRHNPLPPHALVHELKTTEEEQRLLLSQKDRELYEQIIIHSVGKAIRYKILRAEQWVQQMNRLMEQRDTSSGLRLHLKWEPRAASNEKELDTLQLVNLLKKDPQMLRNQEIEQMIEHFRSRITWAKQEADQHDTLRQWIYRLLDYREWFRFTLYYEKGEQPRRELTDSRFNALSGGEKALSMYIPLFAATYSRYNDCRPEAPKIISLDEAFAGVDDENMRDMFGLLTQLDFDYMMTSQVLWGCYDTVPKLSVYEIYRPKDAKYVTLIQYYWNGFRRMLVDEGMVEENA
ncbi:MAG: TIGR02680 family protein [Bacillota bacterium]